MADAFLAALLGFAIGMLYQEFHFRQVTRALKDIEAAFDDLERRVRRLNPSPER